MTKIFRTLCATCVLGWAAAVLSTTAVGQQGPTEAPAGFDNLTNGFIDQASFDAVRGTFEEHESIADGLGPVYNADSCASCHSNPVTGAISQVTELAPAISTASASSTRSAGRSSTIARSIRSIQERVLGSSEVRTFRTSLNTLGDGFVEAIADATLVSLASSQPSSMRGLVIRVPVLEAHGAARRRSGGSAGRTSTPA